MSCFLFVTMEFNLNTNNNTATSSLLTHTDM